MSAFAMFSLKAPSLLAFDKERTEDNLQRVYGIGRVPCDTSMRETLNPLQPEHLRPAFKVGFRGLQRGKALEAMVWSRAITCSLSVAPAIPLPKRFTASRVWKNTTKMAR